jgi:hypothetical protein
VLDLLCVAHGLDMISTVWTARVNRLTADVRQRDLTVFVMLFAFSCQGRVVNELVVFLRCMISMMLQRQ